MSKSHTPEKELFPVYNVGQDAGVNRYMPLPTPASMKATALFGIPLRSALTGQTLTDEAIQHWIDVAISEVEHEIDLYIKPVDFKERYDYDREMFINNYAYIKLNHPNVQYVSEVSLTFSNEEDTKIVQFPNEFVHVMNQESAVQLVPAYGAPFSGFLLSAFSGVQFHALKNAVGAFPGGIHISYRCGFPEGKTPAALVGLVENLAAYRLLSTMGPILFPYNSVGISIDGVSQSTGNAGVNFLTARLQQLKDIIDQQKAAVKTAYQRSVLIDYV
jgi:hypothetical protein